MGITNSRIRVREEATILLTFLARSLADSAQTAASSAAHTGCKWAPMACQLVINAIKQLTNAVVARASMLPRHDSLPVHQVIHSHTIGRVHMNNMERCVKADVCC